MLKQELNKKSFKIFIVSRKTLEVRHLKDFVKSMNPPLGFGNKCPRRQLHTKFMKMNLTLTRKEINGHETVYVNFVEVLFGLVRLALGLHTEGK